MLVSCCYSVFILHIDYSLRTSSPGLDSLLKREVSAFAEELKKSSGLKSGQISLEFFQRKRTRWPFPPENIPWEVGKPSILVMTVH